ncbi:MAG: DUF3987 domain-containing protein, partial [Thermomicrobiales bacterium]
MMTIAEDTVARFAALFAGRTDVAGRLQESGKAFQQKTPVTEQTYAAHLDGRRWPADSLGVYPLLDDGTCWWAVNDTDLGDEAGAWRMADALERHPGVSPYVEVSKSKGHHVWVFFAAPVPAWAARKLMMKAKAEASVPCETFPKQDTLSAQAPYGNFVHLPYYGHPEASGGRYFIGRDGRALDLTAFLDRVTCSTLPRWATMQPPAPRLAVDRLERGEWTGERPACVQRLLDGPVSEGSRNDALIRLAGHLLNQESHPHAERLALDAARQWGLPEREAERTIASAKKGGYWFGCQRKREVPEMAAACVWERCPFYGSPSRERHGPTFTIVKDAPAPALPATVAPEVEPPLLDLIAPHGFLKQYVEYVTTLSDAPPLAHLAAAVTLVAVALGNQVHTRGFAGSYLRPNLWIVFVAPSGARKSSVMNKAIALLDRLDEPHVFLSGTASREKWIEELGQHPTRFLHADEFMALYQFLSRDHMAGAKDFLTACFAANRLTYATKKDGDITIQNPALTLLGGCTPEQMRANLRRDDFAAGFLARILFLPAQQEAPAPDTIPLPDLAVEDALVARLRWIASLSGEITLIADDAARLAQWADAVKQRERGRAGAAIGLVHRAFDFAIKLAMVMQVAETEPGARLWRELDPDVVERAMQLAEWFVANGIQFVNDDLADSEHERNQQRVIEAIARAGGTVARGALRRAVRGLKGRDFDQVVSDLIDMGEVAEGRDESGTKPTTVYRLTGQP